MNRKFYIIVFSFCSLWMSCANISAQSATLSGVIKDQNGNSLPTAVVQLNSSSSLVAVSDKNGKYEIKDIPYGQYQLEVSLIGMESINESLHVSSAKLIRNFKMKESVVDVDQVAIKIKTESTIKREEPFTVAAIETKLLKTQNLDVNQALSFSSGIRVRETGGMGSNYNLSLNGMSGHQVKVFINGIPIDYLGGSFKLNNIPVNLIERGDVYKGVVPIELGSDALGGAINIITNKTAKSYLDASYSYGSFNSHRAALNGQYRNDSSGFTIQTKSFYNFSNNNYEMDDMLVFVNKKEERLTVERFHDDYRSYLGSVKTGFTGTRWADELLIGWAVGGIDQDIQSGGVSAPVGDATTEELSKTYTLEYSKSDLLNSRLDLRFFTLYNSLNSTSIDTSSNRYNWKGEVIRVENNSLGEIVREKTIFEYEQTQLLGRFYAAYKLNENHALDLNYIGTSTSRQGENRLNVDPNQAFKNPNTIQKNVVGASLKNKLIHQKLSTVTAVKLYHFDVLARNAVLYDANDFVINDIHTNQMKMGFSIAGRFFFSPEFYSKFSFEKGYRLPEPKEIFGNGLTILANPFLLPESSNNANLGLHYDYEMKNGQLGSEVNFYVRDADDFIFLVQQGVFSQYVNVLNVLVRGFEVDLTYRCKSRLRFNGNMTWQSMLNNEKYVKNTTIESRVYRDQMPNTPYLFANASVNYQVIKGRKMNASINYRVNYVHEFYLNYPSISIAKTKNIIPSQFLNHLGISLSPKSDRFNLSLEVSNLLDAKAYDNFRMQKPGRAFYAKWRCFLQNQK